MTQGSPADPAHFFARVLADQHYQQGLQREARGEWDRALASYRRACDLDRRNVLYLLARGHICQTHGLESEAEECYRLVLRLQPDDTVALYNQAQLFAARGHLEEARANLAKIVAGGVEGLGDRAGPIYCRLGDIALRREDYGTAGLHFRRALACAPGHGYAAAALAGLERFAEFKAPFDASGRIAPKVAYYGYAGAVLLGLPEDDGIDIPAYPGLGFDSLSELAQTLARLTGLAQALDWRFEAVVALDEVSLPLAIALGAVFGARAVPAVEAAPRDASVLGVTGTGGHPAALGEAMRRLRQRTERSVLYAVGAGQPIWSYDPAIQIASAPGRVEIPWSRGEGATPEHAEAFGAELAAALMACPRDATVPAQVAWYTPPDGHRRLGFSLETLAPRPPAAVGDGEPGGGGLAARPPHPSVIRRGIAV